MAFRVVSFRGRSLFRQEERGESMTLGRSVRRIFSGKSAHRRWGLLFLLVFLVGSAAEGLAATLRGTVQGPHGPLPEAQVTLLREGRELAVYTTGVQGEFLFDRLNPGRYQLQAVLAPYLPSIQEITLGEEDREIVLRMGALNESVTVIASRLPVPVATSVANGKILTEETLRQMPYQALDDRLRAGKGNVHRTHNRRPV